MSKWLSEAEDAIQRATGLTQQLLTFSKGGEPNVKVMTIHEILEDSTKFALRGSNVECDFSIEDNLLPVEIDEGQINQVINNLIINAQHAMPDGGSIQVGAKNVILEEGNNLNLPQGEYVEVNVKDSGGGIPKEHLQKIFDPFFTTKEHGSGLGLASSFSIVKQHNGHITVDSKVNEGSTFTIYLPAIKESPSELEDKEFNLKRGEGNVLIMDDELKIRETLSEMITQLGYNPILAKNSSEAIKIYNESVESGDRLDAVILDLTIPGDIGGKETLKKLLDINPNLKAIVSSGYSENGGISNYDKYGFKAFMPKPYNINNVSKVLHDVVMSPEH